MLAVGESTGVLRPEAGMDGGLSVSTLAGSVLGLGVGGVVVETASDAGRASRAATRRATSPGRGVVSAGRRVCVGAAMWEAILYLHHSQNENSRVGYS